MSDFYIGYLPNAPDSLKGWLLRTVVIIMIVGFGFLVIFLLNYEKAINSTFEYGLYKEFKGTIYRDPVPVLKISTENSSKNLVLVNFGKSGVDNILDDLEESLTGSLSEYETTIRGSLIYYNGTTLLELSDEENSIIATTKSTSKNDRRRTELGEVKLAGELVDSKCFFGVMKPGFGKVHRSCATRCIAGGIPVAVATNDDQYYFARGKDLQDYFNLIGKNVEIEATAYQVDELKYLNFKTVRTVQNFSENGLIRIELAGMTPHFDSRFKVCD